MDIQIINPIEYKGWDNLILSHPDYSFFHSSAWARVLSESYGYTPIYFTVFQDGKLSALIPLMEVNSFLTGKRGVSLPFTDYCDPIMNGNFRFNDLLNDVIAYGKKCGWKSLELRGRNSLLPLTSSSLTYLGHILNLSDKEDQIFSSFRDSTKRNIKKAVKEGVEVKIHYSLESVKEFYRLNSMTRKFHGLPPQPFNFFKKIYDHVISKDLGFAILASINQKNIAGAIYFNFGEKSLYKYGASDLQYQHLRANNLVMWEGIKWYSQNGFKSLCFGRTEPENQGLIQFKSGWGTTDQQINYYRYDLKKGSFVSGSSKVLGFHNKIFKNMPIPILKKVGSILYKHIG
jgi:hypothetical protein